MHIEASIQNHPYLNELCPTDDLWMHPSRTEAHRIVDGDLAGGTFTAGHCWIKARVKAPSIPMRLSGSTDSATSWSRHRGFAKKGGSPSLHDRFVTGFQLVIRDHDTRYRVATKFGFNLESGNASGAWQEGESSISGSGRMKKQFDRKGGEKDGYRHYQQDPG